jgi:hypothetical protein
MHDSTLDRTASGKGEILLIITNDEIESVKFAKDESALIGIDFGEGKQNVRN